MIKRFFPLLLLIFLFWCESAYAETFNNNNYMSVTLTTYNNQTMLTDNSLPFYTEYSYSTYPQTKTYLHYNNYTAYSQYYYDVRLRVNYETGDNNNYLTDFMSHVNTCNIYIENVSQTSDGCQILGIDTINHYILIQNTNIKAGSGSGSFTFQFNSMAETGNPTIYNSLESYVLDIYAKDDTSVSSALVQDGFNSVNSSISNSTDSIINNQNDNTQDIIDNANDNTQDIIDNANDNTQAIIDSNKVCNSYDKVSTIEDGFLLSDGSKGQPNNTNFGITTFIKINDTSLISIENPLAQDIYACFYNINKSLISCINIKNISGYLTIPNGSSYFRGSINKASNKPTYKICSYGNNAITDSITDSDTTQANSTGNSFFSNFHVDSTRGFSSIITAPIRLIQGILSGSSSCSNLSFDVGLKHNSETVSNEVSLPCGSILWNNVPNTAVLLYWTTVFGLFSWWVLRDMYKFIDSIRDPDSKTEFLMEL